MNRKVNFKRIILLWAMMLFVGFSTFAQNTNDPYNVVMTLYDDPTTKMAFNWFSAATGGKVEIVQGKITSHLIFNTLPKITFNDINNNPPVNKAVATGLLPNTIYSFRVGKTGAWSDIGTFTTAKANKDAFSFIYTTDSQADTPERFNIAQITTHAAFDKFSDANFWLQCGDIINNGDSLWQWDIFFGTQQDLFYKHPFAPVVGNHDGINNFKNYFNTSRPSFDATEVSTYTFIYGDAQFFAINSERYSNTAYINSLKTWMRAEANAHPEIKWRIVYYHKNIYTGGMWMSDVEVTNWRNAMAPLFDELNIDIAFQGHDHIYEVIGPVYNKDTVPGSVSNITSITPNFPQNVTGKKGGTFDVTEGTLYFLNNRSGYLNANPNQLNDIPDDPAYGIPNYRSLFTGMLGQKGNPTYSHVSVSFDSIAITTYEVLINGNDRFLDEISIVKYCEPNTQRTITYNTSQTFTNITKIIGEELRITNNATVTFTNSTLRFYKDAKVIIEPGSKLVLDNTTLTNSCLDKLWQGIYVSGDWIYPQTSQYQGTLELKNSAVIENAKNAISTFEPNTNRVPYGGIIKAENSTFRNNRRSVEFLQYPPLGTNPVPDNVSYFKNCTFVVDDDNLFTSAPLTQLSMWAVKGVKITGCDFQNNITTPSYRNRAIYTIDAGYNVDETCSGSYDWYCHCTALTKPSTFAGSNSAIEAANSATQYAINIKRSTFQNNITGINLLATNSFQISEVEMELANNYNNKPKGIHLNNCTGYKIEGNKIFSTHNDLSTGVLVSNADIDENSIYRNNIHNTYNGISVGLACDEQVIFTKNINAFPLTGLQFLCNDFNTNKHDIIVCSDGMVRATQGVANKGADNLFSTGAYFNFYNHNKNALISYYYDYSTPRKQPVTSNNISVSSASANPFLNTVCDPVIIIIGEKSSNAPIATYRELNQHFSEMMHVFYEKGYDEILTNYYNGIIDNEELLQEALAYHESILMITEKMALISNETLYQLKTDSLMDLTQIRDWYAEMYNRSAKYSLAETYYQLAQFEEGFKTLALIPEMYNLNEEEWLEHLNYVALYSFKNRIRESDRTIAELNEAEINELLTIAAATRGLSASMAKGILCFFYEICIDEELLVAEGGKQKAEGGKQKAEGDNVMFAMRNVDNENLENITLVPNPTAGEFTITNYELGITGVEIFDVYGRKQKVESRM